MPENPQWLLDLPLTPRSQELPGIVENCLLQWQSARRHIPDRAAADEAFRDWLLRRTREMLLNSGQPAEEADHALFMVLGQLARTCVSDGEADDAFTVSRWLMATFTSGDGPFEDALCETLQYLHGLFLSNRTTANNRERTQSAITVCDAMIERWQGSPRDSLRVAVADARLQKAKDCMEIGDEQDAARECAAVVADAGTDDALQVLLEDRLLMARHALDAMARVVIPAPEFRTEWLEVQMRNDHREGRPGGSPIAEYTKTASALHAATTNLVRRSASFGNPPLVLLLRNFDIAEQSHIEGERFSQTFHYRDGLQIVNRLTEVSWLVHVASTNAAGLEIDWYSESILHQKVLRPLYLPDAEWQRTIRMLAAIAERVVIWARGKTPGLLEELEILRELRRTQDTVVLLENSPKPGDDAVGNAVLKVFLDKTPPPPVPPLTADDELLADFPAAMMAADVKRDDPDQSPFVHVVTDAVAEVWNRTPVERVRRMRDRMARL